MRAARYRAQKLRDDQVLAMRRAGDTDVYPGAYGIRDTVAKIMVDRWGTPDRSYWATSKEVAQMRARDLNRYDREGRNPSLFFVDHERGIAWRRVGEPIEEQR